MGWLSNFTAWLANVFNALGGLFRSLWQWLLTKLYLLVAPLIAILKLVYDFCRSIINLVVAKIQALASLPDQGGANFGSSMQLLNCVVPVDETFAMLALLFTLAIGFQIIATIRGIKQTVLF